MNHLCVFFFLPPNEETDCPGPETEDQQDNDELIRLDQGAAPGAHQRAVVRGDTSLIELKQVN